MKISGKFILKVAGTLTVISLITAFLLGLVNGVTKDKIAAIEAEKTRVAMSAVVPEGSEFTDALEIPQAAIDAAKAQGGTVSELYGVTNGGAEAGYVAKVAASGSQGTITMMVGIDANGAITGISVVSHSETSGIGTKVVENKPNAAGTPVLDQFIGMSGAGKSTLVRCINLLERPTSGKVLIDGRDITGVKGKELADVRAGIGMIFQNFSLFQQRTVLRNVTFPLELNHTPKAKREERARYLLDLVGLADLADRYPSQLSGGQQQRVAIARALANNPSIMLCDEATSALDSTTTAQILDLLRRINRELNVTLVVITHSLSVARNICDRVAMIDGGRIVEMGDTEALFADPHSDILKTLIADAKVTNHRHTHETADGAKNGTADDSAQKEVK